MSYSIEWRGSNGVWVCMSEPTLEIFKSFSQSTNSAPEAGGLLLGIRRHNHFEILEVTTPTEFDQATRTHWIRSENIHQQTATKRWSESKGEITYLGEWHTHPEHYPSPSKTDRKEWARLGRNNASSLSYAVVIVGIEQLWCGIVSGKNISVASPIS